MEDQVNKPHRKSKEKKKNKTHSGAFFSSVSFPLFLNWTIVEDSDTPTCAGPNVKAFAFAKPGRLHKQAARSHDVCRPTID